MESGPPVAPRRPLARRTRRAVHSGVVLALALALGFFARLAAEPHVALGVDVLADRVVAHVAPGSAADRAGLRVGEPLAEAFDPAAWQRALADPAAPLTLPVVREGRVEAVRLARAEAHGVHPERMPPYKWIVLAACLLMALTGWGIFARHPDVPGIALLALTAALAMLALLPANRSLLWTGGMLRLETHWSVVMETVYHAVGIHWLVVFTGLRARGGLLAALYGGSAVLLVALLVAAQGGKPAFVLDTAAGLMGLATLALCLRGLRAGSPRVRRQVSWVFLAYVVVAAVDFALWEAPTIFGFASPLPERMVNTAMVGAGLVVSGAYVAALAGRGLFAAERVATRALAYALALGVLAALYVGGAALAGVLLGGAGGVLPVAWGAALAGVLGLAAPSLVRRTRSLVDRAFDRPRIAAEAALAAFDRAQEHAYTREALDEVFTAAVRAGVGAEARVEAAGEAAGEAATRAPGGGARPLVTVRPGTADLARTGEVALDDGLPPGVALRLPLGEAAALVGPRRGGAQFSDADLAFLDGLARRYGAAAERLRLQRAVVERELALANARLRIAADLHDDVGASLASIALTGERLATRGGLGERERDGAHRIARTARETADALRDIVWSIQPGTDEAEHLVLRMKDAATALFPDGGCTFDVDPAALPPSLPMEFRRDFFLAYKEALANAARHGHPAHVTVRLARHGERLRLTVADDGGGFDPATARPGNGMRTLRQRGARLGGGTEVTSAPGGGTTVVLTARIPEVRDGEAALAPLP